MDIVKVVWVLGQEKVAVRDPFLGGLNGQNGLLILVIEAMLV